VLEVSSDHISRRQADLFAYFVTLKEVKVFSKRQRRNDRIRHDIPPFVRVAFAVGLCVVLDPLNSTSGSLADLISPQGLNRRVCQRPSEQSTSLTMSHRISGSEEASQQTIVYGSLEIAATGAKYVGDAIRICDCYLRISHVIPSATVFAPLI